MFYLAAATLVLAACGDDGAPRATKPAPHPGKPLYQRYCALCHGTAGEGHAADHAPAIAGDYFLRLVDDNFLYQNIAQGRPGTPMSAWSQRYGGPLDDQAIKEIIAFLRVHQRSESISLSRARVSGDSRSGQRLFTQHCVECHSPVQESALAPSLHNPVFLALASDAYVLRTISEGRPGTPMVGFDGRLEADQLRDLTAFIRSMGRPPRTRQGGPGAAEIWQGVSSDNVVTNPRGPAPRFTLRSPWYVPAAQLAREVRRGARMVLLDARAPSDWHLGHLPGAWPVPFYADESMLDRIPKDGTWIVLYCGCPHAAAVRAAQRLRERGYERLAVLDEGFFHWQEQNYPLVRPESEPMIDHQPSDE